MKVLVVIDMQHDFVDGSLGTPEAQAIVSKVRDLIASFEGTIIFTRDSHDQSYLASQEGQHLPVVHCQMGTPGWQIVEGLVEAAEGRPGMPTPIFIDKPNFGSLELLHRLEALHNTNAVESITLVGLCTDICVVSNALILKAGLGEVPLHVKANCCAGVTEESHQSALTTMRMCQCIIE